MNRTQVYSPAKAQADRRGHIDVDGKNRTIAAKENSRQKAKQARGNTAYNNTAYYDYYDKNPKRLAYKPNRDNNIPSNTRNRDREYPPFDQINQINQKTNRTEKNYCIEKNERINIRRTAAHTANESIRPQNSPESRTEKLIRGADGKMSSSSPQTQGRHNNYDTPVSRKKNQDYGIRQSRHGSEAVSQEQSQDHSHGTDVQNSSANSVRKQYHTTPSSQDRSHDKNIYSESKTRQKKSNPKKSDSVKTHRYTQEELRMLKAAEAARKTAEEQMLRESRKRQKEMLRLNRVRKKKERRKSAKKFFSSLLLGIVNSIPNFFLFLIIFLSLGIFSSLGIFAALHINFSNAPKTIGFSITDTDKTKIYSTTLSAKEYRYGNTIYLNMNDFAGRFGFITVGTADELKYISGENENYILNISVGSAEITVNKMQFRLSAPVIKNGDNVLIPLEFFKIYLKGISVNFDNEKYSVTMVRDIAEYNVTVADGKTPVYETIGFIPSFQETTPNIPENSLSQDILDATDPTPKTVVTYIDTDGDGIADTAVDSVTGEPIPEMNPPSSGG